jgi:hypothetical protein
MRKSIAPEKRGRDLSGPAPRNDVSESALFDLKKSEVCHEANAQRR